MTMQWSFVKWLGAGAETERTAFFSDAVFAIAMTLLAVDIKVPEVADEDPEAALWAQLPQYFSFVLSFAVIGAYWMAQHRAFKMPGGYDQNLQRINLLMLLLVAAVPFASSRLAEYGDGRTVVVYAAVISAIRLVQVWVRGYAWSRRLFVQDLEAGLHRYLLFLAATVPAVFLRSVPIALLAGPDAAMYFWIPVPVLDVALGRLYPNRVERMDPEGDHEVIQYAGCPQALVVRTLWSSGGSRFVQGLWPAQ